MAAAGRFTIFPPSVTYAGPTTLDLTYVNRVGLQSGSKINRVSVSGLVDAGANLLASADPVAMIGTRSLSALIGAVNPTTGLQLTAGGVLRFQQRDDGGGTFMSTSVHVTETFGLGFMCVDSISATQDDESGAEAQCKIYILASDGLTNPFTRSITGATSVTPAFGTEYYLGPAYYNSSAIPGVKSVSLEFGTKFSPFRSSGAVFPTSVCLTERKPVIKVVCHKVSADAAASLFIRSLAGAFVVYLQNAPDAGIRTAVASTAHMKFSASAGVWFVESTEGQGLDDALTTFVCFPTTNITYSAASAIP